MKQRIKIYTEWEQLSKDKKFAENEKIRYKKLGDDIFRNKYNGSFKDYDDYIGDKEMDGYWFKCDEEDFKIKELEDKMAVLYKELEDSAPVNVLREHESCASVWHGSKKLVKIKFLDGEEKLGYIYPCEGDYCGPPYFYTDGTYNSGTIYLGNGELVALVEPS